MDNIFRVYLAGLGMNYLFYTLVVAIMGLVFFFAARAISVGLEARSKIKRTKPTRKRKR